MSAVAITSGNNNILRGSGRVVVRSSAGIPYVVLEDTTDGGIEVWKGNGVTPTGFTEQDSANNPASSGRYGSPACAIDSAGIIHIVYMDDNGTAPSVRYVTFSTSSDTFSGDVAVVADLGSDMTSVASMHCAIAIDSNDKPHITYMGFPTNMGSNFYTVYYANRIAGTWSTPVEVYGATARYNCYTPEIAIDLDNKPYISFAFREVFTLPTIVFYAALGNANNATSFTFFTPGVGDITYRISSIAVDPSGNHYLTCREGSTITLTKHNYGDSWTTWQSKVYTNSTGVTNSLVLNGSDLYVLYENGSDDICYVKYSGTWGSGTLSAEVALETGTFNTVKARWGLWVDNDSSGALVTSESPYARRSTLQIDYVFTDETSTPDIWFNSLSLAISAWTTKSLKAYVGGAWVAKPLKTYVAGSWVQKPLKSYV
jgi:hypothetical protein